MLLNFEQFEVDILFYLVLFAEESYEKGKVETEIKMEKKKRIKK